MGNKKVLQGAFEEHLIAEGKYPKETICRDWEVASNRSTITLDIAIVVNGIVIQAFMLFEEGQIPTHPIEYTQIIDTVAVPSKSLIAIYNMSNKTWNIQSSTNSHTRIASCFMTISKAGGEFVENAKTKIEKERWLPILSEFKKKCCTLFTIYTIYLLVYILTIVFDSDYQLPMSWEFLTYITLLLAVRLLPFAIPFIKHIKIKDLEIDLLASEISKHSNL